jgi:ankyrin repeat protein
MLIRNGCDVNQSDLDGNTPLICATKENRPHLVSLLLQNGANVHSETEGIYRDTALSWGVFLGHLQCVQLLLLNGANIHMQTIYKGKSLLMWAYLQSHYMMFEFLLEQGADMWLYMHSGRNIFDLCSGDMLYFSILDQHRQYVNQTLERFFTRWNRPFEKGLIKHVQSFL